MRLLVLLLLALPLAAQTPEAPLGAYARVGVPVLLKFDGAVTIAGWRWDRALVYPTQLPATVEGVGGRLELRKVRDDQLLVGVVGPIPLPNEPGVLFVAVAIDEATPWRALDSFDRIIWTGASAITPGVRTVLLDWVRMGGDLVIAPRHWPDPPNDLGLGRVHLVRDITRAPPPRAHPVPRIGNIAPEVYDAGPGGGRGAPALREARLIYGAITGVCLLLIVGAAGGWLSRKLLLRSGLFVVLLGGGLGAWRTHAAYVPFAEATMRVIYRPAGESEFVRVRTFRLFKAVGPGAEMLPPPGTPFFYLRAGEPWWGKDGRMQVPEGVQRGFFTDTLERGLEAREGGEKVPRRLRNRVSPAGTKTRCWGENGAFRPAGGEVQPFLSVEVVAVR